MHFTRIHLGVAFTIALGVNLVWLTPLVAQGNKRESPHHHHSWHAVEQAVCVIHPTQGQSAHGIVRFISTGDSVKVTADIEGLAKNGTHAIHVHQFGDCSAPDGTSAGGHYNPEDHHHGLPTTIHRHAGDLGNLQADANGKAHYEMSVDNLSVAGFKNPVLGRAVIIHAKADDGGQPTGNAGPRIGCGVIGIANPEANQTTTTAPATQPTR